ncbi:MAG: hypothetical protein PHY30_01255 [Candidatus Pacebacteria bacterium]|nr:hypothetical protein [Candidatus Paceibacterota bacterium]
MELKNGLLKTVILPLAIVVIVVIVFVYATYSLGVMPATFNNGPSDYPLRAADFTQDESVWSKNLPYVNSGDELRFKVYYHNSANKVAENTVIALKLSCSENSQIFKATSIISAKEFRDYSESICIGLKYPKSIVLRKEAVWYHEYSEASQWEKEKIPVSVTDNIATVNLGSIDPGYTPNDGFVVFFADVN